MNIELLINVIKILGFFVVCVFRFNCIDLYITSKERIRIC